jgi:hypothetical protein
MQIMGKIILLSISTPAIFIKEINAITGMTPKVNCGVLYPCLYGIIRLTNFNVPIVTFRLFAFEV